MKYSIALWGFIILAITCSGQEKQASIAIPGTKFQMVAPAGFKLAQSFSGFSNDSLKASIMVSELPTGLNNIAAGFTKEKLSTSGLQLICSDTFSFQNQAALLLHVSQQVGEIKYLKKVLLFGDSAKTTIVNGIYPATAAHLAKPIQNALLSIEFNNNLDDDPMHAVNFTIDTIGSGLLLAKYQNGTLLFSKDGKIPTYSPTLIVGSSFSSQTIPDKKQFSLDRLKQLPGGLKAQVQSIVPVKQGQLEGFEIVSRANIYDGKEEGLLYQCLFFDKKGHYFMVVGLANIEMTKNLQVFRKMAESLEPK
jgi:hypothetical protein